MQRSVSINKYQDNFIPKRNIISDKLFQKLAKTIFQSKPELKNIIDHYGDMSLYDYSKRYNEPNLVMQNTKRKEEFINTFVEEVERLLDKETAESCRKQLNALYRITTTDHHGPLSEAAMVNSNIHEALPYLSGDETFKNVIVLGCANISFDNFSFPRCLLFHSQGANGVTQNQLPFYSRAVRPLPVIHHPAYSTENLENAYKRIDAWERENTISKKVAQDLKILLYEIYATTPVLSQKTFSDQVTKTNFDLWKKIMKYYPDAPNLIYIEQEQIVNKLLDKYHLDQNTIVHKLLFTPKYQDLIIKYFDGILRGFSTKDKVGTYLFWALPKGQKYRVQLWKNGDYLQTDDGSYKIPFTPEGLRKAIREKELIPSTLMSFIILAFYYGVRLVGGQTQTTYLTEMKEAFIIMQKELGELESIKDIEELRTNDLSINIKILSFLQTDHANKVPLTGIDLVLYGNEATLSIIKSLSKVLAVKEAIYRAMPEYYTMFYKEEERDPELLEITAEDIEKYLGLESTIIPSSKIS